MIAEGVLVILWVVGPGFPSYGSVVMNSLGLAGVVLVFTAVGLSVAGILIRRRTGL